MRTGKLPDWPDSETAESIDKFRTRKARIRAVLRELRQHVEAVVPSCNQPGLVTPRDLLMKPLDRFERNLELLEKIVGKGSSRQPRTPGAPKKDARLARAVALAVRSGLTDLEAAKYVASAVIKALRVPARPRLRIRDDRARRVLNLNGSRRMPATPEAWNQHERKLAGRLRTSYKRLYKNMR
jgi:hypothetical protein